MSNSVRPRRRQLTRPPRPWDSPGKNTGVGCHFLLQCMKVKSESEVAQSCLTLPNPMDCSLPGFSVHGIFQARVLEWVAIAFSAICQQIWKIQQWLQDWKRSGVSFQSQRKAVPKNTQTITQLPSFHMLARLCSKSFKLGFSST